MVATGFASFDTTVDKCNRLLREIEDAYGWPKERRKQSYAALRSVLHHLRDRLPVDEAVQFGAQLPTLLRGVYYDGLETRGDPGEDERRGIPPPGPGGLPVRRPR